MSKRKRREKRHAGCRKVPYRTREVAIGAAVSYQKRMGAIKMSVYRCGVCRNDSGTRLWHIGHRPKGFR